MPVFTMTRGSQEPISQRSRQQGSQRINNRITREEVEKGIKANKQNKPNGNMKKLLGALALSSSTISWVQTWMPMKEINQIYGRDICKCHKFDNINQVFSYTNEKMKRILNN